MLILLLLIPVTIGLILAHLNHAKYFYMLFIDIIKMKLCINITKTNTIVA